MVITTGIIDWIYYVHANGFHGAATPYPCRLYAQKTGTFDFVQKTGYAFTDSLKPYTVPYWSDYDQDGDMDLFIATGPGGAAGYDYCYKNMKVELSIDTLFRMNSNAFTTLKQDGQCYNFIDYDNDKDLDLCLTNYNGNQTCFYNNNSGVYSFSTTPFTLTQQNLSNCWGDYDNDGDLDVIITSDNTITRYFRNNGNNTFTQVTITLTNVAGSAGITNGDYDNDGDLDLFIHGAGNARSLFRNDTVANIRKFVNFKLIGVTPNINAIGAKVKIKATIGGVPTWQYREISAQNSFQSQNDLRVHFGLNNATIIDSLIINWPSGTNQTYTNVIPTNFYVIKELGGLTTSVKENNTIEPNFLLYPNPAKSSLNVKVNFELNRNTLLKILDLNGKEVYSYHLTTKVHEVDISKFADGTYIVSILNDGKSKTQKIIIER
ncbi:MAG: VCBS repeat-containing protein [Sphingobacteriaceae bacterium]|nr:VCBS repeat-containing protein [Sphingobacteriaceae bacterium]